MRDSLVGHPPPSRLLQRLDTPRSKRHRRAQMPRVAKSRIRPGESTRMGAILSMLDELYPDAHCELDFQTPFQLLVATILSAQCTDKRVNLVTPTLFAKYPTPAKMAAATNKQIEPSFQSTGFFRKK